MAANTTIAAAAVLLLNIVALGGVNGMFEDWDATRTTCGCAADENQCVLSFNNYLAPNGIWMCHYPPPPDPAAVFPDDYNFHWAPCTEIAGGSNAAICESWLQPFIPITYQCGPGPKSGQYGLPMPQSSIDSDWGQWVTDGGSQCDFGAPLEAPSDEPHYWCT